MSLGKQIYPIILIVFFSSFLTACGGGGSNNDDNSDSNSNQNDTNDNLTGLDTNGTYDLSEYLYHANVMGSNGGELNFVEKFFDKATGEQVLSNIDRKFSSTDGIKIDETSDDDAYKTYTIKDTKIDEFIVSSNLTRVTRRFTDIGEVFQDADSSSELNGTTLNQNSTCTLLEHFDSFNLATATGNFNLTSGVYNDVLKIECIVSFIRNGQSSPHTSLRTYYAKDIGIIFGEGTMILAGDVYIIEEF